jgi:hypothetical protein
MAVAAIPHGAKHSASSRIAIVSPTVSREDYNKSGCTESAVMVRAGSGYSTQLHP